MAEPSPQTQSLDAPIYTLAEGRAALIQCRSTKKVSNYVTIKVDHVMILQHLYRSEVKLEVVVSRYCKTRSYLSR